MQKPSGAATHREFCAGQHGRVDRRPPGAVNDASSWLSARWRAYHAERGAREPLRARMDQAPVSPPEFCAVRVGPGCRTDRASPEKEAPSAIPLFAIGRTTSCSSHLGEKETIASALRGAAQSTPHRPGARGRFGAWARHRVTRVRRREHRRFTPHFFVLCGWSRISASGTRSPREVADRSTSIRHRALVTNMYTRSAVLAAEAVTASTSRSGTRWRCRKDVGRLLRQIPRSSLPPRTGLPSTGKRQPFYKRPGAVSFTRDFPLPLDNDPRARAPRVPTTTSSSPRTLSRRVPHRVQAPSGHGPRSGAAAWRPLLGILPPANPG